MKTREWILEDIKSGIFKDTTIDGRVFSRLTVFFPVSDWEVLECALIEGRPEPEVLELTEENVKEQLKEDLEFAFEKALDQRGLSAVSMFYVIKMWLWVLDDPLYEFNEYGRYGLPLLNKVADKYGFRNPQKESINNEDICDE